MMSHIYLVAYIIAGLVTAIVTMRVFPPMEGFRPSLGLRLLSLVVLCTLWPVLISLAVWYFAMGYMGKSRERRPTVPTVDFMTSEPLHSWQGSKPR